MDADRMCLNAPPGEVSLRCEKKCDVVIFADGSTCGPRKKERGRDRVGAVMFHRREYCPFQLSQVIRKDEEDPDCPHRDDRYTVLATDTFRDHLRSRDVLLLIG